MIRNALFLLLVAPPLPAMALSCRPVTPVAYYEGTVATGGVVVLGTLSFDKKSRPKNASGKAMSFSGQVTGEMLGREGFTTPIDAPVTVELGCTGPWCAEVTPGKDMLLFLRQDGAAYRLEATPCEPKIVHNPDGKTLAMLRACAAGTCP